MAIYTKICPICGLPFKSMRMNTVFCNLKKNKCRNKARSLSPQMLKSVIEIANRSMTVTPSVPKVVRDFMSKYGEVLMGKDINTTPVTHRTNTTQDHTDDIEKKMNMFGISKDETDILLQEAEKIKQQKEEEK